MGAARLTPLTVAALGVLSNPQSNKTILLEMEKHFPPAVLLDCGLWKVDDTKVSEPPKPNPQHYGMSIVERRDAETGKKVRNEDGEPIRDCVWNEPVLIPYFNDKGELVHLCPHKGMMKDQTPQFYAARTCKEHLEGRKATTEAKQFTVLTGGDGANTPLLLLPSKEYTSPVEFRKWLADSVAGGTSWEGGQNELTALHEDIGHYVGAKEALLIFGLTISAFWAYLFFVSGGVAKTKP